MNSKLIVYPTDFSACAKNAMAYAIAMAKVIEGKIKIIHAIEIGGIASTEVNPSVLVDTFNELEEQAEEKLEKLKKEIESFGLECDYDIIPVKTLFIKDYIEKENPIMIVMGTIGNNGLENKIFGSLASQFIRNTKSMVLTIPREAKFNDLSEVVFASNFHTKDMSCLEFIKKIVTYYKAKLSVVHICEDINNVELERKYLLSMENEASKTIGIKTLHSELLYSENAEDELLEFLENTKPDMLAMVSRKRNFIERIFDKSLAKKMVNYTNTPVLVFPS
ncbi:universal stress protein [Mariniflexile aquimaris]|uniref:Universal stress protein n=1 Tax=Mariniflexile aquimaris TaxID=881009 RepID=A0ABW3BVH6_9FLAO